MPLIRDKGAQECSTANFIAILALHIFYSEGRRLDVKQSQLKAAASFSWQPLTQTDPKHS